MTAVSHGLASSRSKSLDHNNGEDAHMLDTGKLYIIYKTLQGRRNVYNFGRTKEKNCILLPKSF